MSTMLTAATFVSALQWSVKPSFLLVFKKITFSSIIPVISRNILTDPSSSQPTADDADTPAVQSDPSSAPSELLNRSGPPDGAAIPQEPMENPENTGFDGTAEEGSQPGNGSAPVAGQTEPLALGMRSPTGKGSRDPAKPAHADEM